MVQCRVIFEVLWAFIHLAVIGAFLVDVDIARKFAAGGVAWAVGSVVWVAERHYGFTPWVRELAVLTIALTVAGVGLLAYVVHRLGGDGFAMLGGSAVLGAWAVNASSTLKEAITGDFDQVLYDIYLVTDGIGMALLLTSYGLYRRRTAVTRAAVDQVPV